MIGSHLKQIGSSERGHAPLSQLTLLRDAIVVDVERGTSAPRHILISGRKIEALFDGEPPAIEGASTIDCSRFIVVPGFVNGHTHSQGGLAKALGDRLTLEHLLNAGSWFNHYRSHEDMYISALLSAAEMVRAGCTTCYDLSTEWPGPTPEGTAAVASAYAEIGMRAIIAPQLSDRTIYDLVNGLGDIPAGAPRSPSDKAKPDTQGQLAAVEALLRGWSFGSRDIELAVSPTIPVLCSDEMMHGVRRLADEHGLRVHTHLCESQVWANLGHRIYGKSTVARLADYGLLSPRFTGAHAVWLTPSETKLLGEKGCFVAHNPASNLRLGSGIAKVRRMMDAQVTVGLGTDACHCGDHLSMLEATRMAAFVSRVQDEEAPEWVSAAEALRMATAGSAKGLNLDHVIGRIAPGYAADLVLLDSNHVSFVPLADAVRQVVLCADTSAIHTVLIGGRAVFSGGQFLTIDYAGLVAKAKAAFERLAKTQRDRRDYFSAFDQRIIDACRPLKGDSARSH